MQIMQRRKVLVADDSRAQRRMLALQLSRWGYLVAEAETGDTALALAQATDFDFVLSDWMMPGLTGPEFCRAFRDLPRDGYGYFVLLSSKSEKNAVADGLDGGADDFLTKPVNSGELRARLMAGERILGMQAELRRKNRDLSTLYDALGRDLDEARRLQQSLVPDHTINLEGAEMTFLMRPSGHVGGDLVGWFPLDAMRIGLFALDVAGHGVASALMTARLAGLFSANAPDQNLAFQGGKPLPPETVAARLNRLMLDDIQGDRYATLVYADICLQTGKVVMVQAGHPHPMVLHSDGSVTAIGAGGFPVGLIDCATFPAVTFSLRPGDRLVIPSDGITECPGLDDDLGQTGLASLMRDTAPLRGLALHDAIIKALAARGQSADFPDDVSAIILDYAGPTVTP
jgi:sigma-B regulation protein RsbU (phosphoserine phosphatase)